jgi:HSP20 family protein
MNGIIKWNDPFFRLPSIVRDFENYINDKDFWGSTTFESLRYIATTVPLVNAFENDKVYVMEVLAPKLKKEDLTIEIEDSLIHLIPKEIVEKSVDNSEDRLRKEYNFSYAERTFKLPENVDTTKINAVAENGIITVTIPKKEVKTPVKQQIAIK